VGKSTIITRFDRIHAVANAFRELGIGGVQVFEDHDPQMAVAKEIKRLCGKACVALLAVNALVSYMLEVKGEEHWNAFASYVRTRGCPKDHDELIAFVEDFTKRRNRRFLDAKLRRLRKLRSCPNVIELALNGNLRAFNSAIAKCLSSSPNAKTVVFSVKMAYYGLRALGKKLGLPEDLPIPVDFRVAYVTYLSQMINVNVNTPKDVVEVLMGKPKAVRKVWEEVSKLSGIPPLNLDAPVWVIGRYVESGRKSVVMDALRQLSIVGELGETRIRNLVNELLYLLPE